MVRVAVLGCGLLGVKIAGEFAYHGHRVKCYDNNIQALNSVYQRYQSDKAELLNDQIVDSLNFTGFNFNSLLKELSNYILLYSRSSFMYESN
jgi:3-hydroxyacyl-CoA dehydrogenase